MAWFKKLEEGETQTMNPNASGRSAAEQSLTRPEPREARPEPRTEPRVEPRAATPRAPETKPVDSKPPVRAPEVRAPEAAHRACVLGPTLRFRGELSAQEDLIVQGSVEGSITHTQSLTIGADGSMKGDIRARVIVIDGKVDGDLYATESVSIRATARVKGNLFAPRVAIMDGAFFQGQIDMQPSGAAVQEHSARLRQSAYTGPVMELPAVDRMLGGS
jgi:cytoskeletal protein CcmA (bactofilin family)